MLEMSAARLWWSVAAWILLLSTDLVSSDMSRVCDSNSRAPTGSCGSHLAALVSTICGGWYAGMREKRDVDTPDMQCAIWRWVMIGYIILNCVLQRTLAQDRVCSGSSRRSDRVRRCGNQLAEVLKTLCKGRYNYVPSGKRSAIDAFRGVGDLFMPKRAALSYLKAKKRPMLRSGIVCECCINSCANEELMGYCGKK